MAGFIEDVSDRFGREPVCDSVSAYDYNHERMELVNQLDELAMQRAGFRVRWRELEEEARRAGAYPGWLRP